MGGTRILGMYAEGRTGKVTRRKIAEHMTANGGARILGEYAEGRTGNRKDSTTVSCKHQDSNGVVSEW